MKKQIFKSPFSYLLLGIVLFLFVFSVKYFVSSGKESDNLLKAINKNCKIKKPKTIEPNKTLSDKTKNIKKTISLDNEESDRLDEYIKDIRSAYDYVLKRDYESAMDFLRKCPLKYRNWEWHYLKNRCKAYNVLYKSKSEINCIYYDESKHILYAGCENGEIIAIDVFEKKIISRKKVLKSGISKITTAGDFLIIADSRGKIYVLDKQFNLHKVMDNSAGHGIFNMFYSQGNSCLYVIAGKGVIFRFKVSKNGGKILRLINKYDFGKEITAFKVNKDNKRLAVFVVDWKDVVLFDLYAMRIVANVKGNDNVRFVSLIYRNDKLYLFGDNGEVYKLDFRKFQYEDYEINAGVVIRYSEYYDEEKNKVLVLKNNLIKILDLNRKYSVIRVLLEKKQIKNVIVANNGDVIVSMGNEIVKVERNKGNIKFQLVPGNVSSADISSNGKIAVACVGSEIHIYDLNKKSLIGNIDDNVNDFAYGKEVKVIKDKYSAVINPEKGRLKIFRMKDMFKIKDIDFNFIIKNMMSKRTILDNYFFKYLRISPDGNYVIFNNNLYGYVNKWIKV